MNDLHLVLEDVEHNTRCTLCISREHHHAEIIGGTTEQIRTMVGLAESLGCEGIYLLVPPTNETRQGELLMLGFSTTTMDVMVWNPNSHKRNAKNAP